MSITFSLRCDGCGRFIDDMGKSPADVRRKARAAELLFRSGRFDLCEFCNRSPIKPTGYEDTK